MRRLSVLVLLAAGCDYSGDFLFAGAVPGVPDIWVLTPEGADSGPIVPAVVDSQDALRAATMYAELGATPSTEYGGVTFEFVGTGGSVCLWIDPEVVFWNQSVSPNPTDSSRKWAYPDNVFDDGDLDLFIGRSVFYTGSPGVTIGDFVVAYEDSLGNDVPISQADCPNQTSEFEEVAAAGRGAPELCTIDVTDIDVSYTVLLRTWSTPLDDDRLGFGVILADGDCENVRGLGGGGEPNQDECVILGEAMTPVDIPEGRTAPVYYGFDALAADGRIWERSMDFEAAVCGDDNMRRFCENEKEEIEGDGSLCEREVISDGSNRCYCGDPEDTPESGAF